MKKKRKVRWGSPVGIKQFHIARFGTERSFAGEFSLFLLCTLLFFGAALHMLQSMFEWQLFTGEMLFRVFFITVLVSGLTEAAGLLKQRYCTLARAGIFVAGTAWNLFYLFRTKQGERILYGLQAVASEYVSYWNRYYGTSFRVASGEVPHLEDAIGFVAGFLCFLLVWYGRVRRKSGGAVLVPFLSLVAGLLVGVTPTGLSMLVAVSAVFLSNGASFRRPEFLAAPDKHGRGEGRLLPFLWLPMAFGLLVICILVTRTGGALASERVTDGRHKLKQKNKEILQEITEWTGWQEVNVAKSVERAVRKFLDRQEVKTGNVPEANYARLDNETPEYEEVTVVKAVLEKKPSSGAYLIGFYADAYEDGVWDTDVRAFEKLCEKAGYDPKLVADRLITLSADRVAQHYGKESLAEFSYRGINGWMYYAKANLVKTYLPYFAEVTAAAGVSTEGDSRYIKEKNITKIPFAVWNYDVDDLVGVMFRGTETDSAWEKEAWEKWYESYVTQAYVKVPENMVRVKAVAEEIEDSDRDFYVIKDRYSVNFDRINKAYQVADWMRRNTTYSMELSELPKGEDPIEYFLGTSRQGYCMHYAGASVMILRQLGVPARYVSGYVAASFLYNEQSRMYEAVVKDSAAHAWVEIYLNGIGWVPVEVTKGYSVLPSGTSIYEETESGAFVVNKENWPEDKNQNGGFFWHHTLPFVTPAPTATPDPSVLPSGNAGTVPGTPGTPGSSVSQVGGTEAPAPSPGATPIAPDTEKKPDEAKVDLSLNPVILLFALPVIGLYFGVVLPLSDVYRKKRGEADERRLRKKTRHFGNRQKIKLLNQRLYRKLRRKGKISPRFLSDEEYDEVLRKYSAVVSREERERYMHLVKAAAFSYNEFTDEEVAFCRQVYHKVLYERAKEDDRE